MVTKEGMVDSLKGMVTKEDMVNRETKVDMVKEAKVDITKETKVVDTIKEIMVLEGMVNNHGSNSTQHHIPPSNKVMEEVITTITVVVTLTVMVLVVEVPVGAVLVVVTDMHPTKLQNVLGP